MKRILSLLIFVLFCSCHKEIKIDRKAVVIRHNVHLSEADSLNSLTVGNGKFAMTVDVTGLQSYPDFYEKGVPLGTQSEWGWHAFPAGRKYDISETDVEIEVNGRMVPYARQWPSDTPQGEAANYLRQNPHRIHLGQLGFIFFDSTGSRIDISKIKDIQQELDLWTGEILSTYTIEGEKVEVITLAGQKDDNVAVKIKSPLLTKGRIKLKLNFPYPTDKWTDVGNYYDGEEASRLMVSQSSNQLEINRTLDSLEYATSFKSNRDLLPIEKNKKGVVIEPESGIEEWTFVCTFSPIKMDQSVDFDQLRAENKDSWSTFWNSGGIIDFGRVNDERAEELERRMVLSMYLTKVNCGGKTPPQETGLTYNSWYGKPHMEMTWWHGVHFALWGRPEILENHLDWYLRNQHGAESIAKRQGYKGIRWQKMTDPWGGETASSVGSYLIWQQPHPIYFAELIYQSNPSKETLERYAEIVERTAEFMADYAYQDSKGRYILGPALIAAQESHDYKTTINPTYELAYWRWALEVAQQWREKMGKERNVTYDKVLEGLAPLPLKDGLYLAVESAIDSYTNERFLIDHPSVFGAFGMLPQTKDLAPAIMQATYEKIEKVWVWDHTWGWDFPMTAMTATRLGMKEKAVNALLMPIRTNTYLKNGHNFQDERLTLYLPGNGGLLTALALMATENGFPADWELKFEGISKMP